MKFSVRSLQVEQLELCILFTGYLCTSYVFHNKQPFFPVKFSPIRLSKGAHSVLCNVHNIGI